MPNTPTTTFVLHSLVIYRMTVIDHYYFYKQIKDTFNKAIMHRSMSDDKSNIILM